MVYAASIIVVKKVLNYLEIIVRNDAKGQYKTSLITDDPVRLVSQLREAKSYLHKMDHQFYNNVYSYLSPVTNYSFRLEKDRVIAKLKTPIAKEDEIPLFSVESHEAMEIIDSISAIGYIVDHKNIHTIIFPSLNLTDGLIPLKRWCEKNNYELNIGENGVQVRKKESQ